jgi:hypothetical protein
MWRQDRNDVWGEAHIWVVLLRVYWWKGQVLLYIVLCCRGFWDHVGDWTEADIDGVSERSRQEIFQVLGAFGRVDM